MGRSDRYKPNLFERWEKLALRTAAGCLTLLLIAQALLMLDTPRRYLSRVDRLEGEAVSLKTPIVAEKPLTITENAPVASPFALLRERRALVVRMIHPPPDPTVYITVNGQRAGDFRRGDVKIIVYEGDYVEIDASALATAASFVVSIPGGGLTEPEDGLVLEGREGPIPVGKVKFKH
ncbi:MAG TPA: hypothetical protein PKA10_11335 [Selenomonadales bacterium]|nr:hypothetical protein [Selenomonadales bacterium]